MASITLRQQDHHWVTRSSYLRKWAIAQGKVPASNPALLVLALTSHEHMKGRGSFSQGGPCPRCPLGSHFLLTFRELQHKGSLSSFYMVPLKGFCKFQNLTPEETEPAISRKSPSSFPLLGTHSKMAYFL